MQLKRLQGLPQAAACALAASMAVAPAAAVACDQIGTPRARVESDTTVACFAVGVEAEDVEALYTPEWSITLSNACLDTCTATVTSAATSANGPTSIEIPSGASTSADIREYGTIPIAVQCAGADAGAAEVRSFETYEGGCGPFGCAAGGNDAPAGPAAALGVLLAAFGLRRQSRYNAS